MAKNNEKSDASRPKGNIQQAVEKKIQKLESKGTMDRLERAVNEPDAGEKKLIKELARQKDTSVPSSKSVYRKSKIQAGQVNLMASLKKRSQKSSLQEIIESKLNEPKRELIGLNRFVGRSIGDQKEHVAIQSKPVELMSGFAGAHDTMRRKVKPANPDVQFRHGYNQGQLLAVKHL